VGNPEMTRAFRRQRHRQEDKKKIENSFWNKECNPDYTALYPKRQNSSYPNL
jgi:hypothetical protein